MRTFLCVVQCCCNSAASPNEPTMRPSPSPCTMPSSSCRISVSLCSFESIPSVCPVPLAQLSTLPSRPAAQPMCCAVLLRVCVLFLSARLKQEQLAAGHSRTSRTHKQMTATLRWRETKVGWRLEKRNARSEGAMNPGMRQGTGKWRGDCKQQPKQKQTQVWQALPAHALCVYGGHWIHWRWQYIQPGAVCSASWVSIQGSNKD